MQWVRRKIGRIANNLSTAYRNTATIKGDQTHAFKQKSHKFTSESNKTEKIAHNQYLSDQNMQEIAVKGR